MTEQILDPRSPEYMTAFRQRLHKRRLKHQDEIHRLQGQIGEINDILRAIDYDSDRYIQSITMLEKDAVLRKQELQEAEEDYQKPKVKKKKGVSIIEKITPPIEEESKKKGKKKAK
jgi:uncharacterized protein YPO0396